MRVARYASDIIVRDVLYHTLCSVLYSISGSARSVLYAACWIKGQCGTGSTEQRVLYSDSL